MNDFNATTVPWAEFLKSFQDGGLGEKLSKARENRDSEEGSNVALEFLDQWLWGGGRDDGSSHTVTISSKGLSILAKNYQLVRPKLAPPERSALDALFIPFAGDWLEIEGEKPKPIDLPADMKFLSWGGLSLALPPERCQEIAVTLREIDWEPFLAATIADMAAETRDIAMRVSRVLASLVTTASGQESGVISVFQI
jgi:hypothetical protein